MSRDIPLERSIPFDESGMKESNSSGSSKNLLSHCLLMGGLTLTRGTYVLR